MVYVLNIYVFVFGQWLRIRRAADVSRFLAFFVLILARYTVSQCLKQVIDAFPSSSTHQKTASDATIRIY